MIRYLDMFAGIGGFRSGLERVGGFECVGYCEIDKFAKQAYEALYDTSKEVYYDDATKDILITEKGKKDNIPNDGNWWKTLDRYIDFGSADTQEFGIMA